MNTDIDQLALSQILRDGVLQIDNLFSADELSRLVNESNVIVESELDAWRNGISQGEKSSVFLDVGQEKLIPRIFEVTEKKLVQYFARLGYFAPRQKDVRLRLTTPYPLPYVQWHRDHMIPNTTDLRATIYLSDVDVDAGEFCYVKGSHCSNKDGIASSDPQLAAKSGHTVFRGRKGTMIIFDPLGVHGVRPNNSYRSRLALMYYYHFKTSAKDSELEPGSLKGLY